jgi:hypothetical protein
MPPELKKVEVWSRKRNTKHFLAKSFFYGDKMSLETYTDTVEQGHTPFKLFTELFSHWRLIDNTKPKGL